MVFLVILSLLFITGISNLKLSSRKTCNKSASSLLSPLEKIAVIFLRLRPPSLTITEAGAGMIPTFLFTGCCAIAVNANNKKTTVTYFFCGMILVFVEGICVFYQY